MPDPRERFSDRAEVYAKYRPTYPAVAIDFIVAEAGLQAGSVVVDIGCGTGISSAAMLARGSVVIGVEPNADMRQQARAMAGADANLRLVDGSAEQTGLADACGDLVLCAQAFHWFDRSKARAEFVRILRPPHWVALMWNNRLRDSTPAGRGYEAVLRKHGTDYKRVDHRQVTAEAIEAFAGGAVKAFTADNSRQLDEQSLVGAAASASYLPPPGSPGHAELAADLRRFFAEHQQSDRVTIPMQTQVFVMRLS